jgi:Zn-dependent protease
MDTSLYIIFQIVVLLFSITIHEVSHGLAANSMGDTTAKDLGRLSLNPIRHLDIFGSFLLPFFLYLTGLPIFGYAKPVPYNPLNLNDQRWGPAKVAIAGPISNLMLALFFGLSLRFLPDVFSSSLVPDLFAVIVFINLILAIFNLFPVPPLDGHWILFSILPTGLVQFKNFLYRYGLILFLALIFFGGPLIFGLVATLFRAITGVGLS